MQALQTTFALSDLFSTFFWIPGFRRKGPKNSGWSVLAFVYLFENSVVCCGIISFFKKNWHNDTYSRLELLRTELSRKFCFGQKMTPKFDTSCVFRNFWKILSTVFPRNENENIVIYISLETLYLKKFLLSSYGPKCSEPIRLEDSLKCNTSKKQDIKKEGRDKFDVLHEDKQQSFPQADSSVFGGYKAWLPSMRLTYSRVYSYESKHNLIYWWECFE